MSTRQNKKQRKNRNNAHNRERTVTTLTEDPNTHYLVPTPSEEPAGSHIPPAFGGGGKMHNNVSMGPPQFPNNYGGFGFNAPYTPVPNMHQQRQGFFSSPPQRSQQQPQHNQQQQQQQHQQHQQQHQQQQQQQTQQQMQMQDMRSEVPLPPGKNDLEILQNLKKIIKDNQHPFFKAIPDPVALAKLYKGKLTSPANQGPQQAPSGSKNEPTSQPQTSTSGPGQAAGDGGRRQKPVASGKDRRPMPAGGNQGNNSGRYNNAPGGSTVSNLNLQNLKISQNEAPPPSGAAQSESRSSEMSSTGPNQAAERRGYDYSGRYHKSDSSTGGRPHDSGYDNMPPDGSMPNRGYAYGKDDGYRPRGWTPRDYPHPDDRDFDPDRNMAPRPPGGSGNVDARQLSGPDRAGPPGDAYDRDRARRDWPDRDRDRRVRQPPVRRGGTEPPVPPDARHVSENPPPVDARVDPRATPARAADRPGLETEDIRSSRASSVRPMDATPALASGPPAAAGDDGADDSFKLRRMSLRERITPSSRTPTDTSGEQASSAVLNQDRNKQPRSQQKDHGGPQSDGGHGRPTSPSGGPPPPASGDRGYGRPPSPSGGPPPPMSGGPAPPSRSFQPRSPSIEGRSSKGGPPSRGGPRGPGRSMSRDRGPGYRPDYHDSRYPPPGGMDIDGPPPRYEARPYRDFSPPPPPGGRGPPPGDGPPGRDYPYPPVRRDWGPDEDDYYKHSRSWEGPPHERSRYEREYGPPPRSGGWPDRDYVPRDAYPPGGPIDDRYPPGPLGRDGRPPPAGYNAPFNSRVRPRSPSPVRRGPGPGPVDDPRPPMKRSREDFSADYYPPAGGRDGMRRPPPGEYPPPPPPPHPPRSGSPGPSSNSGWAPPPGSSGSGSVSGAGERDYRMGRDDMYPPPGSGGYDRRSPGPPGGRAHYNRGGGGGGGYGRGGEPRDRGGYGMPRP